MFTWSIGALPDVSITGTTSTDTSITVNIGTISSGVERVIIGYHRLDLGVPVVGEYVNNDKEQSRTFSSLVPGAKYRITAWGLGGSGDRRTSQSPAVMEVTTMEQSELMQWSLNWAHKQCMCTHHYSVDKCLQHLIHVHPPQVHLLQDTSLELECLMMGLN